MAFLLLPSSQAPMPLAWKPSGIEKNSSWLVSGKHGNIEFVCLDDRYIIESILFLFTKQTSYIFCGCTTNYEVHRSCVQTASLAVGRSICGLYHHMERTNFISSSPCCLLIFEFSVGDFWRGFKNKIPDRARSCALQYVVVGRFS